MKCMIAAVAALLAASSAHATVVYSNNFDLANGSVSAQNYTPAGFTVVEGGFDLFRTGDGNGVTCRGGGGGCLDLAGTGTGAGLGFSDPFAFGAGDLVTLRYAIGGNQRSGSDGYAVGFVFDQLTAYDYTFIDGLGSVETGSFEEFTLVVQNAGIPAAQEFRTVLLSFRPRNAGTFSLVIDGLSPSNSDVSDDDFGLILDDVSLDVSAVPEPAAWTMMILGFGLTGAAMRRRPSRFASA